MENWIPVANNLPEIERLVILITNGDYNLAKLINVTPEARAFFKAPVVWEIYHNKHFLEVKLYDKWKYVDYENI